jgi:hypothetical protein
MQENLKIQLERFDTGQISIKILIDNVRKISNQPNQNQISKNEIIEEYLEQQKKLKEIKHKADNLKAYQKWVSNSENKIRRSELDKLRYQKNKSVGNDKD